MTEVHYSRMSFLIYLIAIGIFAFLIFLLRLRYRLNGGFFRRNCRHIETRLDGKTAIITGGNAGIGKETAIDLARRGARVIIGCRNQQRASEAVVDIRRRSDSTAVVYRQLDLSDQDSVRRFAKIVLDEEPQIHYLINNAGIGKAGKGHRTEEGYNMVFATNYFGPFLLTNLLLNRLKESYFPGRIITVSSVAHTWIKPGDLHFNQNDATGRVYPGLRGYGRSKLANVLFTKELARRLDGTGVTAFVLHPGAINTSIIRTGYESRTGAPAWVVYCLMTLLMNLVGSNEESGAQTTIYCAVEESITNLSGGYFDNCHLVKESDVARDSALAGKLWEVSCQATGLEDTR